MKMAMLGAADLEFQKTVDAWLDAHPTVQIHHVAFAPTGERWFSLLVFYTEKE
jgi:hypothetical protein